jgi:hypothetical protein
LAIGEGVPVPMRLRFDALPEHERPLSHSARFSERWSSPGEDGERSALDEVVAGMRGA